MTAVDLTPVPPDLPFHGAKLYIGRWHSECSWCGHDADPREKYHYSRPDKPNFMGCGAKFFSMSAIYFDGGKEVEDCLRLRPDLKYKGPSIR